MAASSDAGRSGRSIFSAQARGGEVVVASAARPSPPRSVGGDVVGAAVLVIQVVGVLPDIETDDGLPSMPATARMKRAVLVGGGADSQFLVGGDDEARPKPLPKRVGADSELFLEFVGEGPRWRRSRPAGTLKGAMLQEPMVCQTR